MGYEIWTTRRYLPGILSMTYKEDIMGKNWHSNSRSTIKSWMQNSSLTRSSSGWSVQKWLFMQGLIILSYALAICRFSTQDKDHQQTGTIFTRSRILRINSQHGTHASRTWKYGQFFNYQFFSHSLVHYVISILRFIFKIDNRDNACTLDSHLYFLDTFTLYFIFS